jgi:type II secretory pathway pseudopilin PulG
MLLPSRTCRGESGYIMMTLLLTMALLIIFAAIIVPSITFDIKRDREEEMIHRGVQYSRAIRAYYKKFSKYPAKIEDLENTNQMRFLRKRYKDPLTGKDFKLLRFGEVKMSSVGLGGGMIPGASAIGQPGTLNGPGGVQLSGGLGANTNSPFGQNQQPAPPPAATDSTQSGTDGSQPGTRGAAAPGDTSGSASTATPGPGSNSGDKLSSTTFGGAPIVGVASTSKEKTIREYDKKKKYDEWQFVYDPTLDRGFLITTPYQPTLQMFGAGPQNVNGPGGAGQNGTNSGFGTGSSSGFSSGFGSGSGIGFGNSPSPTAPSSPSGGSYGNQNPPSSTPQQQ